METSWHNLYRWRWQIFVWKKKGQRGVGQMTIAWKKMAWKKKTPFLLPFTKKREKGTEGNKDVHSLWRLTLGNKGMIFTDLNNGASRVVFEIFCNGFVVFLQETREGKWWNLENDRIFSYQWRRALGLGKFFISNCFSQTEVYPQFWVGPTCNKNIINI